MDQAFEVLMDKIKKYNKNAEEDRALILKAYTCMKEMHSSQLRHSGEPYFIHPYEVACILADMELDAEMSVSEGENGEVRIAINGEGASVLIGHHGDTLDSLQYLANLAANKRVDGKKEDYVKVSIDVEGYRAKREETLRALARRMASKVLKYKKSVMLEPMNPYERRIIHSEIQEIEGVSTNSIGSENNRKIVIFLDGEID